MQSVISNGIADVTAAYVNEQTQASDPARLVKRLNLLLAANQISAATETRIVNAITSISISSSTGPINRVRAAIMLVMACPEYLIQK
jgi:hypothetical protein